MSDVPRPIWLASAAALWGLVLVGLGIALPVYTVNSDHGDLQPRHSLVRVYGYAVLWPVAIPFLVCLAVLALLQVGLRRRSLTLGRVALTIAAVLAVGALVGFVTFIIGMYVFPSAIFLVGACLAYRNDLRPHARGAMAWPDPSRAFEPGSGSAFDADGNRR